MAEDISIEEESHISPEELASLWSKSQRKVEAYVYSLIPDYHQVDDIVQNVAVAVVRKRSEYDPLRPFMSWVLQFAKFEVLKHRRSRARDRLFFSDELVQQLADAYERYETDLADRRQAFAECVQQVKGRAHRALELKYAQQFSSEQIAEQLGIAAGAARMLLHRTRKSIQDCVAQRMKAKGI